MADNTNNRLDAKRRARIDHAEETFFDDDHNSLLSLFSHGIRMTRAMVPVTVPTRETIKKSVDSYAMMISVSADLDRAIKKAKILPRASRYQRAKRDLRNAARNFIIYNSTLHLNNNSDSFSG